MAFEVQRRGLGFSMVELLSICPTNWRMSPLQSVQWLQDKMIPYYPLGDYKVASAVAQIRI